MRVLVLGSTGMIGRAVMRSLADVGCFVVGVSRSPVAAPEVGEHRVANRAVSSQVLDVIRERNVDVVVDMLALSLDESENLLRALEGNIVRYVMIRALSQTRSFLGSGSVSMIK